MLTISARLARCAFPEREDRSVSAADEWALGLVRRTRGAFTLPAARQVATLDAAMQREQAAIAALDDAALRARLLATAPQAVQSLQAAPLRAALLLAAEAAARALGMRPFATQLAGAATLLRGRLAEMQTGEGKTLTAGLAAAVAGAAGVPVHVITVNDYLAARDAEHLGPLYAFFGLTVGVVHHGVQPDARRAAYACAITYCVNKELVFDYLRDRVDAGGRATAAQLHARRLFGEGGPPPLLRGLHFAIVDEADSVLIDEARTPLILAERAGDIEHSAAYPQALDIASTMQLGTDFTIDAARRALHITPAGRQRVEAACASLGAPWQAADAREHLLAQALRAQHLFKRDQQYLVDGESKVQIIDEYTGRVLPGRTWEQGLHQMIEAKEGLPFSEQTLTLARITYQRFFCRYLRLSGMTGTAREVRRELAQVYGLHAVTIPTHKPCIRQRLKSQVCIDEAAKWRAVATLVADAHRRGQPVLVGTRSVAASERLSAVLAAAGLPHVVLNARQDAEEAAVVARAGQRGAITVATNIAGRGTDIALGEGVDALGGLCVVLTEFHESSRIDRQLAGRCARQGNPGTVVDIVALDDDLFTAHGGAELALLRRTAAAPALTRCRQAAQRRAERIHARTRRETLRQDRHLDTLMAFAGVPV